MPAPRRDLFAVEVDDEAEMSYVKVSNKAVVKTLDLGSINVDVDENGHAVGVEFFGVVK